MRKQLLWIVFLPLTTLAQHLGFNGAGFFENSNEEVIRYMQSWTGDFTIRVPGVPSVSFMIRIMSDRGGE